MSQIESITDQIFRRQDEQSFNALCLDIFRFQYKNNTVYRLFVDYLGKNPEAITHYTEIPFLPISFFKTHKVVAGNFEPEAIFTSSGTTGTNTSSHQVKSLDLYKRSFLNGFEQFFGHIEQYNILALLPSYLEREGSSLVLMAHELIRESNQPDSGFFLHNYQQLSELLFRLKKEDVPTILLGVTYALLDMAEQYSMDFPGLMVMETGGMKGKRKEMVREELHQQLKNGFGIQQVFSEYGMTELLSQAYSKGDGIFQTPSWMKILIRDTNDPFSLLENGKSGGINVIDLANIYSCSFIETQDLGKIHTGGSFEILGRFDNSDIRGCNLLVI